MLSERAALALVVACAFLVTACSDAPAASPPPAGGAATGGSGSSASASGSSGSAPLGGAGGSAQAGTGGVAGAGGVPLPPAMACSSYMDESSWSLVVQIKNERAQPVYVGQKNAECQASRVFEVRDGARTLLPAVEQCPSSCQQLMQSGPTTCTLACAAPSTIALQPGETLKVPWDGRFGVPQTLPASCTSPAGQGSTTCVQAAHIDADVFTFTAHAGTSLQCLAGASGCACTPNANGGCTTAGSTMAGTIITTEYFVNLEPGEKSPSGEPPYIGLVFQD